jgi:uncharacterized membrane protein YhhN
MFQQVLFKKFTIFYLAVAILYFLALFFLPQYVSVTKPLIMSSLIGFYISTETKQNNGFLLGMIFALLGDIFLMFDNNSFFIAGLFCFLLMQWTYLFTFKQNFTKPNVKTALYFTAIFLISCTLLAWMWPYLGSMKWHVTIYFISILSMVFFAVSRDRNLPFSFSVLAGAILFLISDALLAVNKFAVPFNYAGVLVMLTYIAAQYLIVTGIVGQRWQK